VCALLPNGSYFMPYWKFQWTSLLCNRTSSWTNNTHPQNVCALLKDLLDSGGVCTSWMKVCVYVCMYVCVYVLDVVLEFICSPQCHIEQRFTYELYGAVKRWR